MASSADSDADAMAEKPLAELAAVDAALASSGDDASSYSSSSSSSASFHSFASAQESTLTARSTGMSYIGAVDATGDTAGNQRAADFAVAHAAVDDAASEKLLDAPRMDEEGGQLHRPQSQEPQSQNERYYTAADVSTIPEDDEDESTNSTIQLRSSYLKARRASRDSLVSVGLPEEEGSEDDEGDEELDAALGQLEEWTASTNEVVHAEGDAPARAPPRREASNTSSREEGSLPSYHFGPTVKAKSDAILRSYKPTSVGSSGRRFGGGFWRRNRSSASAASAGTAGSEDIEGSASGFDIVEGLSGKAEVRTVATESDVEKTGGNHSTLTTTNNGSNAPIPTGTLLKDTYSFIYVYPTCSAPFFYALLLFAFQSLVYFLLLSSLIDTTNPGNMLHVPPSASVQMRIAQGCAILIAVLNGVDIMVALNNLLRVPDAIVVLNGNDESEGLLTESSSELSGMLAGMGHSRSTASGARRAAAGRSFPAGTRFKFANGLRLIEGCLAVAAAFILIVRSDDVIEMFINFAALEFVVNLDNVAFALAEHGLISDRLRDAARFVGGLGFSYRDHRTDVGNPRRATKGNRGGGACTASAGRIARLKGSYLARLFGSPARCVQRHPDGTRRTTLFVMTAVLFGCWGWILAGLDAGNSLCKSLDVEFFHAHVAAATAAEADEGIKPFLMSRSGTYVAMFAEGDASILDRLSNLVKGTGEVLAYRKADPKVETPAGQSMAPASRLPLGYDEVVFYDPALRRWVFASCDPAVDLLRDGACSGPQVHSVETDAMDLTALSSGAFHIMDEDPDRGASSMVLPASITCTECDRRADPAPASAESHVRTCGLSGGVCSDPQEDPGLARQCICPPGQYGLVCADHYGTTCPTLQIVRVEDAAGPPGAVSFETWEERRPFTLLTDERGVGNTPIWERIAASKGYRDRIEWRGGTHWTITRRQRTLKVSHTVAIAEGTPAASVEGMPGASGVANSAMAFNVQPPPAGLEFHAPKSASWGTQPDFYRPFASHKLQCKAARLGTQLITTP